MNRAKSLRELKWLVDYVALRCTERDDITGFRVEIFEDLGVKIAVKVGLSLDYGYMAELISFCELATSNTNVVGVTLDHLFTDLTDHRKEKAIP